MDTLFKTNSAQYFLYIRSEANDKSLLCGKDQVKKRNLDQIYFDIFW